MYFVNYKKCLKKLKKYILYLYKNIKIKNIYYLIIFLFIIYIILYKICWNDFFVD